MYEKLKKDDLECYDIAKYWNKRVPSRKLCTVKERVSISTLPRQTLSTVLMSGYGSEYRECMWLRIYNKISPTSWLQTPINDSIMGLARNIIINRDCSIQPILADALEEAGWTSPKLELFRKCGANTKYYLFFHLAGIEVWTP